MRLTWHNYRYYPYERELAQREVAGLLSDPVLHEMPYGFDLIGENDPILADRITYFAGVSDGCNAEETLQSRLESSARSSKNRQATRYSVHGLHEYKGKFNPQVVRALLNIFGIMPGHRVLDPFCGSGTTLVECSHIGVTSYGIDLNPFAVFLSNAKLQALATPVSELRTTLHRLLASIEDTEYPDIAVMDDPRGIYLESWFDSRILHTIESLRETIEIIAGDSAPFFLVLASNLLRDYSFQDPNDLRIRRRKSRLPTTPFIDAFHTACNLSIDRIEAAQSVTGIGPLLGQAVLCDAASITAADPPAMFDASITSPPYAMALPYIDTQRLSLVWLNLIKPERIRDLESELIGSREMRGRNRLHMISDIRSNEDNLPEAEATFCHNLQESLGESDGFRRQAVPALLYRYFALMQQSFRAIRGVMRPKAPFALIVGHNHSVLGGTRYDIDTPTHLASIASGAGWMVEDLMPLQTYRRYGYHMNNAVSSETLIILRNL